MSTILCWSHILFFHPKNDCTKLIRLKRKKVLKRMFWSTVPEVPELRVEVRREGVVAPRVDVAPDVRHPDVVASVRQDQRCNRSNNNGDKNNLVSIETANCKSTPRNYTSSSSYYVSFPITGIANFPWPLLGVGTAINVVNKVYVIKVNFNYCFIWS